MDIVIFLLCYCCLFIFNFFGLMMPTQVVNTYIFIKIRKTKCLSVFDAAIG